MSPLRPIRSFTVDTSFSGSSGFMRNASAPASNACSRRFKVEMHSSGVLRRFFSRSHSSRPMPPEIISSTIDSAGSWEANFSSASSAVSATSTS